MTLPRLHVVAAVLQRDRRYFVQERQPGKHMAGLWEFPGGKVESGESAWAALVRELKEELGISALRGEPLIQLSHDYPDRRVHLDVWRVTRWVGDVQAQEQQVTTWCHLDDFESLPLLPADGPVIRALALPHRILVTPDCSGPVSDFLGQLTRAVEVGKPGLCILKQTQLSDDEYASLARGVAAVLTSTDCKLLLHGAPDRRMTLVDDVGASGLHVTAACGAALTQRPQGLQVFSMSCHHLDELRQAVALEADFALLGSVAPTTSHPNGSVLGWDGFREAVSMVNMPVFAIGGMKTEDEVRSRLEGGQGIAAIGALWRNLG